MTFYATPSPPATMVSARTSSQVPASQASADTIDEVPLSYPLVCKDHSLLILRPTSIHSARLPQARLHVSAPPMIQRRLQATEYTVGWVCALPVELAAAQEMLDEEHEALPQDNLDPNVHTLDHISDRNVVLTCLPEWQFGIGPAAAGATRVMSKFKLGDRRSLQYPAESAITKMVQCIHRTHFLRPSTPQPRNGRLTQSI